MSAESVASYAAVMDRFGPTIAVTGVGGMGLPISRRLLETGRRIMVFDTDPTRRAAAADAGLSVAESAIEAVAGAQLS